MWRKSSYSANASDCVEVGRGVGLRDSKAPGTHLSITVPTWNSFLSAVKTDRLRSAL